MSPLRRTIVETLPDLPASVVDAVESLVLVQRKQARLQLFDQLWQTLYPDGIDHGPSVIAFLQTFKELRRSISRRETER